MSDARHGEGTGVVHADPHDNLICRVPRADRCLGTPPAAAPRLPLHRRSVDRRGRPLSRASDTRPSGRWSERPVVFHDRPKASGDTLPWTLLAILCWASVSPRPAGRMERAHACRDRPRAAGRDRPDAALRWWPRWPAWSPPRPASAARCATAGRKA